MPAGAWSSAGLESSASRVLRFEAGPARRDATADFDGLILEDLFRAPFGFDLASAEAGALADIAGDPSSGAACASGPGFTDALRDARAGLSVVLIQEILLVWSSSSAATSGRPSGARTRSIVGGRSFAPQ